MRDVTSMLLQEFADRRWLEIEKDFLERRITCRQALRGEFECLRGEREELIEYVDRWARIDPHFKPFLSLCEERGIPVRIVSEGLDFYIEHLLQKYGIEVEFFTNRAHFENGSMSVTFPNASDKCEDCGTCKLELLKDWRDLGKKIVYAGDGLCDICPAESSDIVFAKGSLLSHFKEKGLEHLEFRNYGDIISKIRKW